VVIISLSLTSVSGPYVVSMGSSVTFNGSGRGPIVDVEWNFGDGSPIESGTLTPTHTYTSVGIYTVILTITYGGGIVGTDYTTVTVLEDLSLNVPYNGTLNIGGHEHLFRVNLSSGVPLRVSLNDTASVNRNEIYIKHGALPTTSDYDYKSSVNDSADQEIFVPMAYAGTWYILVYGSYVSTVSNYTLLATTGDVMLAGVTPVRYGISNASVLTLTGAGFDTTTNVALVNGNGTVRTASVISVDSFTQITATFNLTDLTTGLYTLRASSLGGGTSELTNAFEILPAGEAKLETNLILPSQMGYHMPATIYIEYENTGNESMPAPIISLTATQNGREGAFLTLDPTLMGNGFWTSAEPAGFSHSIQVLASGATPGVLQPGESGRVPVYYAGWQQPWDWKYPPLMFGLGVVTSDDTTVINWDEQKDLMKPGTMNAEAWDALFANFVAIAGDTWGDYVKMIDDNAIYLGQLGKKVNDIEQLANFTFMQADGLKTASCSQTSSTTDASVQTLGIALTFTRFLAGTISQRFELGPLGRGWSYNWQYSLHKASDGTVTVLLPSGGQRIFQPDSRNSNYLSTGTGVLTALEGGAFSLREADGMLYVFRADGKLDYKEDRNGNRITADYSGDLLTSLTHSSGQYLQIDYNAAGRIQTITDSLGRQTQFSYTADNEHLSGVQYYDGRTATYVYGTGEVGSPYNALIEMSTACACTCSCDTQYFTYDAQGRLSGTYKAGNAEAVTYTYDIGLVTATDALGSSSKSYYDYLGALVKTVDPLGNTIITDFDEQNRVVNVIDAAGCSYSYRYDSDYNLVSTTDQMGHMTRLSYTEPFNSLASRTDARGYVTQYDYDDYGNLISTNYPDGSRQFWAYDTLGQITEWTNGRGNVTSYAYNGNGQITSKTYADGSQTEAVYDARGNTLSTTDSTGTTAYTNDANDRLIRIDYPAGQWLQFTYDMMGRPASSLDQAGHHLDYQYNSTGRLESLTDENGSEVVHYTYDAVGRMERQTLTNGIYTTYAYDAAGQMISLVNYNVDGSILSRFDYTYDSRGRRISMDTLDGTWTYEYDDTGQLIHAVLTSTNPAIPNQDLGYVYDALGNRIYTIENGVTTEYTVNNMNQYTRVGDTTYSFDADGNLVREVSPGGTNTYTYNDENRLTSVTKGADTWQYVYDVQGNRVSSINNGNATNYITEPLVHGNAVGEYDASGNIIAHYSYGTGLLARTDASGDVAYYTYDAGGNTQQLVTVTGEVANSYTYTPFGETLIKAETIPNSFQFVGQYGVMAEGNGLNYMQARYYDPEAGRFTSVDPLGYSGDNVNLYRYVTNNPISLIDPTGLSWWSHFWCGFTCGIEEFTCELWCHLLAPTLLLKVICSAICLARTAWCIYECAGGEEPEPIPTFPPEEPDDSTPVVNASDPNGKLGPSGFGYEGFIQANSAMSYRVDFENDANASAPAQQVVIMDQLNANLNRSSFEFSEFGFGDQFITVPDNTQNYQTTVPVSYNGADFEVQIDAGVDLNTGLVTVTFQSIDPATGLPPTVDIGFLPPEDGTGRGQGHFSYIVDTNDGLTTGIEIRNVALISFDGQEVIATNQVDPHDSSQGTDPEKECLNTIDAVAPTSLVDARPATVDSASFTVSWNGSDDVGGSGIAGYDIYVSDNGSSCVQWLAATAQTSAVFTGIPGHTYGFYSRASDNAGNIEGYHATAVDTTTTVNGTAPVPMPTPTPTPIPNVPPVAVLGSFHPVSEGPSINFDGGDSYDTDGKIVNYEWDFGDGSAAVTGDDTPAHAFGDNGMYTVTLTVTDDDGATGSVTAAMTVNNAAPIVNAGADMDNIIAGIPVSFSGSFTDPGWLDTHTIEWNFGDGSPVVTGTLTPTHTYTLSGDYTVILTVADDDGGVGSDTLTVHVNAPPEAVIGGPYADDEGSPVNFDGSGSYDPDGSIANYEWDFGDGSAVVTGDAAPAHAYGDNGEYTVTLTVTDDEGATDTATVIVTVDNVAPTVDAGSDVFNAMAGTPIDFSGSFTDPGWLDTHTIEWDFGDGTSVVTGTLTPSHTYASGGTYTVTLTVTDDDGGTGVDTVVITTWNYAFEDTDRGTELRINTDEKTFQFIAPDYNSGIIDASLMLVHYLRRGTWINIVHMDGEMIFTAIANGGERDTCQAVLFDRVSKRMFHLHDEWGIE